MSTKNNSAAGLTGQFEVKKPDGTVIKLNLQSRPVLHEGEKHGNSTTSNRR